MWTLFGLTTFGLTWYMFYNIYKFYFIPTKMKSFKDEYVDDEYILICYRIKFEDLTEETLSELTEKDLDEICENRPIKYITIEYMFNGKFMKYITYEKDITFPIYKFNVSKPKYEYYPETIILNDINITNYITPYLGPLCNFYADRVDPIKLEDVLSDHPAFVDYNFNEGTLMMISNDTPIHGKKCSSRKLPCKLLWKRHAAVDPRDDHKLS